MNKNVTNTKHQAENYFYQILETNQPKKKKKSENTRQPAEIYIGNNKQKQKGIRAATGRFTKQRDRTHRSRLRKSLDNEQATQFLPLTHHPQH